jgi:agmatine/peptidylarginine deiminase
MEREGQREMPARAELFSRDAPWGEEQEARGTPARSQGSAARWAFYAGLAGLLAGLLILAGRGWERLDAGGGENNGLGEPVAGVLPGEFEHCQGLLFAPPDDERQRKVVLEVIAQVHRRVRVYLLARDELHRGILEEKLRQANLADFDVHFLLVPFGNPWARDFGPLTIKSFRGGFEILDLDYAQQRRTPSVERQLDDAVPAAVAAGLGRQAVHVPVVLDGGNFLSNGAGLCLTTTALQEVNAGQPWETTRAILRQRLGAQQLVVLEPLAREVTSHVDMFCTFTAPDTVVVARCDERIDPENAAILDRNAQRLGEVKTPCGPLKVVRLPMVSARDTQRCLTYTNVIYANGLLLVPSYAGTVREVEEQVQQTYRQLLPGWEIRRIEADALLDAMGSLHCISANLHGLLSLPLRSVKATESTTGPGD